MKRHSHGSVSHIAFDVLYLDLKKFGVDTNELAEGAAQAASLPPPPVPSFLRMPTDQPKTFLKLRASCQGRFHNSFPLNSPKAAIL